MTDLMEKCKRIRREIFKTAFSGKTGHIAPAFSCVEVLATLYLGGILKYDPQDPTNEGRDRFILSKGHACLTLYVILSEVGFFRKKELKTYCQRGSMLGGHPRMDKVPGVEATTGALGHGLPYATGIALAGKRNGKGYHTYVVLGDGECQEGSVWEAALFAPQNKLDNLTAIIDYNKLQAMDELKHIVNMESLAEKWEVFGWDVHDVDGHDLDELTGALSTQSRGKPKLIVANTVKGKGVSFMENKPIWHFRFPNEEELAIVMEELEMETLEVDWDEECLHQRNV